MKSIGREFMELTKYKYEGESEQEKGTKQPPLELSYDFKGRIIDLPDPSDITVKDITLREAIENRHTIRSYTDEKLTLEELTFLLWCTQGVKDIKVGKATLRNVPSAGARHAFETYLLINKVEGLKVGLYRYVALENKLIEVEIDQAMAERVSKACSEQKFIEKSAVTFIWTAVPNRMTWRYSERGYRYMHLDAGHVCQNLYLAAEAVDCGVCAIASYDDDELNSLLKINEEEAFAIYVASLGKK
ncbi:SagB/ThcOx family dehydrogenase [Clostridium polynesiense]|uniref:SagB/ThcOx family dehydrogenase n=1 Tax=Clostridium polynesiense TaxID=1325933 RepID=UPI00058EB3A4|nr:SagB/ThcOx family dehydrogenase [Clostridium polynesiense]